MRAFILFISCLFVSAVNAQIDSSMWIVNGAVADVWQQNSTLFIGGEFNYIGPANGAFVPVQNSTEYVIRNHEMIRGSVRKCISDGAGGWYICGDFYTEQRHDIRDVAHLNADFSLDTSFYISADNLVQDILLSSGKLYICGYFTNLNGAVRRGIGAVDPSNGSLLSWNANISANGFGYVYALVSTGGFVYAGGSFDTVAGAAHKGLAELDPSTGAVTAWNANVSGYIKHLEVEGSNLYVGGSFSSISSQTKKNLTTIALPSHTIGSLTVTVSNTTSSAWIEDFELVNNNIYVVGSFSTINSNAKNGIAKMSKSGVVDGLWVSPSVRTQHLAVKYFDGKIYSDGQLGDYIGNLAILDTITGAVVANGIRTQGMFSDLTSVGDTVLFCGTMNLLGTASGPGVYRNNLAAINLNTGIATGFAPNCNDYVNQVRMVNGRLVIGGTFTLVNGVARTYLASLDPVNGLLDNWNPVLTGGTVQQLKTYKDLLYVGGAFDTVNFISQRCIATFDTLNFNTVPCALDVRKTTTIIGVRHFNFADDKLFVSGSFDSIAGVARKNIACIDLLSGSVSAFNANAASVVFSTAMFKDKLYAVGIFASLGDSSRNAIACLDTATGKSTAFNANLFAGSFISDIVVLNDSLLVGGQPRVYSTNPFWEPLLIIHPDNGGYRVWNEPLSSLSATNVNRLSLSGNRLHVMGTFNQLNNFYHNSHIAWFVQPQPSPGLYAIRGNVFRDRNMDCVKDSIDNGIGSMILELDNGDQYAGTDANGDYLFMVQDTGSYSVAQIYRTPLFNVHQYCPANNGSLTAQLTFAVPSANNMDFADSINANNCQLLYVDVMSERRRVCRPSKTIVTVRNYGTGIAPAAMLKLTYPSTVFPMSSVPAWTVKQDSLLEYQLGDISAGTTIRITLLDSVTCDVQHLDETACVHAEITPVNSCQIPSAQWDGSNLAATGSCTGTAVRFVLKNTGNGNMSDSSDVRVFMDSLLVYQAKVKLNLTDSAVVNVPVSGQTVRLEADQRPFHPSLQMLSATVEGCGTGGPISTGYVNQYNDDDDDPQTAISCLPVLLSFDPNEKLATPSGLTAQHFILNSTELEYTLHFQNTGNDTAYEVVIVDTLDENVDLATILPGSSSASYDWTISGHNRPVISFIFHDINLPDSGTNYVGSQGFVQFAIKPKQNVAPGTILRNQVGIYFDFNAPVITNTTEHMIVASWPSDYSLGTGISMNTFTGLANFKEPFAVSIEPNPTKTCAVIRLSESFSSGWIELLNTVGKPVFSQSFSGDQVLICPEGIGSGIYQLRVYTKEGIGLSRKLVIVR